MNFTVLGLFYVRLMGTVKLTGTPSLPVPVTFAIQHFLTGRILCQFPVTGFTTTHQDGLSDPLALKMGEQFLRFGTVTACRIPRRGFLLDPLRGGMDMGINFHDIPSQSTQEFPAEIPGICPAAYAAGRKE